MFLANFLLSCFNLPQNVLLEPGRLAQSGASLTANQGVAGSSPGLPTFFGWDLVMKQKSTTILTLPLIQEGQLSVTGERMGTKYW